MLCELRIENLALIESLHLNFEGVQGTGLVVMTGETGAGKSIMLKAIKMLTGGRAQTDWVRSGADQCTVEALFEVNPAHQLFLGKLADSGLGNDTTIIIKRVISAKGRSRLYVNGSLATARIVKELTDDLLNVASQHDQQQLLQHQAHLDFIDTLGEHWHQRSDHGKIFRQYVACAEELQQLRKQEQEKEQKADFLRYQLNEIDEAAIQPDEDKELQAEKKRLKNADSLIKLSQDSYGSLSTTVTDALGVIRKNMEQIAELDGDAEGLAEELSGYCFQAEDLASRLRRYRDNLESDPYKLEQVTERIDVLQSLKRKYGETIEAVLEFAAQAKAELEYLENLDVQMKDLEKEVERLRKEVLESATSLSNRRKKTAIDLQHSMAIELSSLAFNKASLEVRWQNDPETIDDVGATGWDSVEFYFSANQGEPARPLAKVASGGELSRLMLAIKCLLARRDLVETVVFDEVDAGIGGEAAEAVARKIQELAGHHQVFCITHLPQIAARGTDHYLVEKKVVEGRTISSIGKLSQDGRVQEVARMLAGQSVTEQTSAWAKELLNKSGAEWQSR